MPAGPHALEAAVEIRSWLHVTSDVVGHPTPARSHSSVTIYLKNLPRFLTRTLLSSLLKLSRAEATTSASA